MKKLKLILKRLFILDLIAIIILYIIYYYDLTNEKQIDILLDWIEWLIYNKDYYIQKVIIIYNLYPFLFNILFIIIILVCYFIHSMNYYLNYNKNKKYSK